MIGNYILSLLYVPIVAFDVYCAIDYFVEGAYGKGSIMAALALWMILNMIKSIFKM